MQPTVGAHLTEELLEKYALRHLADRDHELIEDHVFVCGDCLRKLEVVEEQIQIIREALRLEAARTAEEPRGKAFGLFARPAIPIWAGVAAAVLLSIALPLRQQRRMPSAEQVTLQVTRGSDSLLAARVREGSPLTLRIPAAELPASSSFRLEIADSRGDIVWSGAAKPSGASIESHVTERLAAGSYWVRLYDASSPPALQREFGLTVQ